MRTHRNSCQFPHAQRVQRVRLGEREPRLVPARAPAAPGRERQAKRAQFVTERVARGVDRCRIPQRLLRPGGHLGMAELLQEVGSHFPAG
ncbi:MAG TPA: hypothetical protein VKB35_13705 [Ktedonobacteraceae bacterium]|nr:hypothetical protein [Ktedonobacteraceae bacterium]